MKKILIITDTWDTPINGVITTMKNVVDMLRLWEYEVEVIHPWEFETRPCPGYPEIPLVKNPWKIMDRIRKTDYDAAHIVVEGPLGLAAKLYFDYHKIPYTTAYHTKFPEFVQSKYPRIHPEWVYPSMKFFHGKSKGVLVPTKTIKDELDQKGFKNTRLWSRGVDRKIFTPLIEQVDVEHPILLNVGRVSVEKNLEAFYNLDIDANFVQVGDGPQLEEYKKKYPHVYFAGKKQGKELAQFYKAADVFVFPSVHDTFGLVMIEAMACGTPVAAFNVASPIDVVKNGETGFLSDNLQEAITKCLTLDRKMVYNNSMEYTWESCTQIFIDNLVEIHKRS